jgi:hypothetical protein
MSSTNPGSPRVLCNGVLAIAFACLLAGFPPARAAAQMQIDEVVITSGPAYYAGVFSDFFVAPVVFGTGIASVTLTSQSGPLNEVMVEVTPGKFACDEAIPSEPCENFTSLAQISALGNLTFSFVGDLGETDTVTIPLADYNPGAGQAGFPGVVSPAHLATGVSPTATLQWSSPPAWVQAISVDLEELLTGNPTDDQLFLGTPPGAHVTTTTWAPSGMINGTAYDFDVSFLEIITLEDPRQSSGGRAFIYTSAFESFNNTVFFVPEPGRLAAVLSALPLVAGLARRRRNARVLAVSRRSARL